jgi:hypothetical protein
MCFGFSDWLDVEQSRCQMFWETKIPEEQAISVWRTLISEIVNLRLTRN